MMQCQFMFVHLRKNSANIEVDLTGVRYLEAFIYFQLCAVNARVFQIESLLQILQGVPELVGFTE